MTNEKITIVAHYGYGAYLGDRLIFSDGPAPGLWPVGLLLALGYEADVLRVDWEEMPYRLVGASLSPYCPPTLAELTAHLEQRKRGMDVARVASLRAELARLEGKP